jgi:hypothetical protein
VEKEYILGKDKLNFWVYDAIDGVAEGIRHDTAIRLVGRWYNCRLTSSEIALFLAAWNTLNSPPLEVTELQQIYKTIKKWQITWPGDINV